MGISYWRCQYFGREDYWYLPKYAPCINVSTISINAESNSNVTRLNNVLPNSINEFGPISEGKIKLDYKIFNHTWIEDDGWSSDKVASVGTNQSSGENITYPFNVDFTLSAVNIAAIESNYENFYIYWKATDSANNISYEVQEVRIIDNTIPTLTVYDVSGYAAINSNTKELSITLPDLTDNLSNEFGPVSEGKIKLDYKIFNHNFPDDSGELSSKWETSTLLANTVPKTGENVTSQINVLFTLTGANFEVPVNGSGYENFYIVWKATDSANNIAYKIQEVRITDDIAPTWVDNTAYQYLLQSYTNDEDWLVSSRTYTITMPSARDDQTLTVTIFYSEDEGNWTIASESNLSMVINETNPGGTSSVTKNIKFKAVDAAGNSTPDENIISHNITINFDTTPDTTEPIYTAPAHHSTSTAEYLEGDGPFTVGYNFTAPSDLLDVGTYIADGDLEMHYYIGLTVLDSQTQLTDSDLEALAADVWTKVDSGLCFIRVSIESPSRWAKCRNYLEKIYILER